MTAQGTITASPHGGADGAASPTRVMIVDDSLIVRTILSKIISAERDMAVVGKTGSAETALASLARTPADVVLLDLEMPGMGGLHALPRILSICPGCRVLVVSSLTRAGAEHTLAALSTGAADTMLKPRSGEFDEAYRQALLQRIRVLGRRGHHGAEAPRPAPRTLRSRNRAGPLEVIGIGASTGGIHALCVLLRNLPRQLAAPILVTQHLPANFMAVFAHQLELASGRSARVLAGPMALRPGCIVIAPGDAHLVLRREEDRLVADPASFRAPSGCLPSVDPMFESMAETTGAGALGIVLSGMGRDGALGARSLVDAGGNIIAQDEASSSVWGMPRAVAESGLASAILPPDKIALRIAVHAGDAAWK